MKEKTVQELKRMLENNDDFQLIDVREEYEYAAANINGNLIPMGTINDRIDEISKTKTVVMHCKAGKRSETVIRFLESNFGFDNLYNLRGGIMAYAIEIDPTLNVI
jgi:adenylyltransferase/sulfurtransferase